jgi:poly(A) polymerase
MTERPLSASAILRQIPCLDQVRSAAGKRRVYLVGGAVRNTVLGLPTTDFDFVVRDPHEVAARLADALEGALVPLHDEFPTSRVVVRQRPRRIDLDFAAPRASSLRGDLQSRDFTINALAAGPLGLHPRLFDPCDGRRDILRGVIRMTSADSPAQDPLRILRAYRFAAQLGFRIDPRTRRQCRCLADLLRRPATERVGAELLALCRGVHYAPAMEAMASDTVLGVIVPEFEQGVGVEQLGVHEFDVATHSLLTARNLSGVMDQAGELFPGHADEIAEYLSDAERRGALVLAGLLHDLGKPDCRVWEGGRFRFFGHAERGTELADQVTRRLRLPRRVRQQVKLLVGSHMRLIPYIRTDKPTRRAKRRFLRETAPHTVGVVLLCMADWRALRGDGQVFDEEVALHRLRELFAVAREVALEPRRAKPPLTGKDLIGLGLQPGPLFGEILEAVEDEWIAGNLDTRSEAVEWVRARWLADRER